MMDLLAGLLNPVRNNAGDVNTWVTGSSCMELINMGCSQRKECSQCRPSL